MISGKPRTLKKNNRRIILELIRRRGEIAVADLSKIINLSKTTVMKIIDYYLAKNLILAAGKGDSTFEGGKKPQLFRFNAAYGYAVAFHVFLDEIYAVVTDLRAVIIARASAPIVENESLDSIMEKIHLLFERVKKDAGIEGEKIIGLAVGMHGITDFGKGTVIASPHFPCWGTNVPFKDKLEKRLAIKAPILIDNQIRFQVWAEKELGAAKGKKTVIVIEGGEGLVAGILVKNRIKRGMHGLAGEIGHMIINPCEDRLCSCGGKGCFEVMVSVSRMIEIAEKKRALFPDSVLNGPDGKSPPTPERIFQADLKGDKAARETLDDIARWFAIGISNIVLMYDPEMIILQGVYTQAGPRFLQKIKFDIDNVALAHITRNVEIVFSGFGKDRGVLGGASFVIDEFLKNERLYVT